MMSAKTETSASADDVAQSICYVCSSLGRELGRVNAGVLGLVQERADRYIKLASRP